MTDHEWLKQGEIDKWMAWQETHGVGYYTRNLARGVIADRCKMRDLLLSVETQLPVCTRDREDIEDMREATADD